MSHGTWGIIGKDGQWLFYMISAKEAKVAWKQNKENRWRLCKNIRTDEEMGCQRYSIIKEEKECNC